MSKLREQLLLLLFIAILFIILLIIMIAISFDISIKKIGSPITEDEKITDKDRKIADKIKNSIVHLWGCGTGFICKEDEKNIYILTNKHVVELYNLQKHKETKIFENRIFLPYIKFIDPNIQYKNEIQKIEINQEKFSKQKYLNDIQKIIKNNKIDENMFGRFYTHSKNDIAIVAIPKASLNIAPNHKIQTVGFAKESPKANEPVYVFGNAGGLQSSPILTKGKVTSEINPLILAFTNRDENHVKSNAKIYGGHSGSPEFNENGEVVGIATFNNSLSFKIPLFINYQLTLSGDATYSINSDVILNSFKEIKQHKI